MEKVTKEGTVEALHSLQSKMPSFLEHVFVKRKQAEFFEKGTAQMQPDEADFAENYICQHQDEVQAAHSLLLQCHMPHRRLWIHCTKEKELADSSQFTFRI